MRTTRILAAAAALLVSSAAHAQETKLESLKSAAKSAPTDAAASLALGRALRRAGHEKEAITELRRGAFLASARTGDLGQRLYWEIARSHMQLREFGQAMVSCRALGALPGGAASGLACTSEARLVWQLGGEALADAASALKLDPKLYDAKIAEGRAYEFEMKTQEAEKALREAIAWKPDIADAHMHLGRVLVGAGKRDDGIAELRKAVQLDADWPEANYELAVALPSPQSAESVQLFEKVTRERPSYAPAWIRFAEGSLAIGKLADAKRAAEQARKLAPGDISPSLVIGRVALAEGKVDDAMAAANAALKLVTNSAKAKLLLADAYAKKGEIDLALEQYQAAWGLDHGDPAPLVRAAEACHAAGRDTSARAFALRATQEFPKWGPGWAALGDALAAQKEPAAAKAAYEKALAAEGSIDKAAIEKKLAALK